MHLERYKLIYLHVPKTGGNSIQSVLLPFSEDRMVLFGHQDGKDRFEVRGKVTSSKHAKLADYASGLGAAIADYKVAISVRHPFDRAISLYFSPHRWMRNRKDQSTISRIFSRHRATRNGKDQWFLEQPVWNRSAFIDFLDTVNSMVSFLDMAGSIRGPDFVIRYESMQADFQTLTSSLGLAPRCLPRLNGSAASHDIVKSALADKDLRALVCERYADDMQAFNYS